MEIKKIISVLEEIIKQHTKIKHIEGEYQALTSTLTLLKRMDELEGILPDIEAINEILDRYLNHYSLTEQVKDIASEAIHQETLLHLTKNWTLKNIFQVATQGYCTKRNENKTVDADLIIDIARAIYNLLPKGTK